MRRPPVTEETRAAAQAILLESIRNDITKFENDLARAEEQIAYWTKRRDRAAYLLAHRQGELRRLEQRP